MAAPLTTVISLSPTLACSGFWYPESTSKHPSHQPHQADGWLIRDVGSFLQTPGGLSEIQQPFYDTNIFWMDVDTSQCAPRLLELTQ